MMSQQGRRRMEPSDRACVECQRRKTRCIIREGQDVCTYCVRSGKTCVMSERFSRTPLTRKNLDAAENRCKELEILLASLNSKPMVTSEAQDRPPAQSEPASGGRESRENTSEMQSAPADVTNESYDWQEETTLEDGGQDMNAQDGMAASQRHDGYHGLSSASTLLESLSSVLPPKSSGSQSLTAKGSNPSTHIPLMASIQPGLVYSGGIASSAVHAHFINTYFLAYNSSYPILHERTFRNQLDRNSGRPSHSIFQIIYYMVLAIGEWLTASATENHSVYYDAARSRLRFEILETGNTRIVQAFLLLGNYLQKRDRPNTAYNFIGIAYRVALGLGLHREPRSARESQEFIMQQRRQLFWTLYCFDSGFSLTTGRPTLISDTFIDTKKPKNVDEYLDENTSSEIREVDYPTTCSAIIAQARLANIANKIHNNLLSVRSFHEVNDFTMTMEQSINNWRSSLPVYFFREDVPQWFLGPRKIVLWKEANLRIILLLASQRHASDDGDKVVIGARCQSVAVSAIFDIAQFCEQNIELIHVGINWYAVYFLLHAILALAFQRSFEEKRGGPRIMIQENESARAAWDSTSVRARECLEVLRNNNKAATRTLQILDRLQESFEAVTQTNHTPGVIAREATYHREPHQTMGPGSSQLNSLDIAGEGENTRPQNMLFTSMPSGVSPDMLLTDNVMSEWLGAADPSLHMYLDNETAGLDAVFQGFHGFPSVMEPKNFAYTTNMMHMGRNTP